MSVYIYKQMFRRIIFTNEKYFKLAFSHGCARRIFGGNKTPTSNLLLGCLSRLASRRFLSQSADEKQLSEYRFVYPEFLPGPQFEFRNRVRERLEREDMLRRRNTLHVPEFYVGSVLAVSASDPHAPGRESRFVGICIARTHVGLRATFTLRNIVDRQGVEVLYELYNPMLLRVEVLRLERRLDEELYYLRDAPPHHSTFPFDMEPEFVPEGQPPHLNTTKVRLNPPPWHAKWEQRNLLGAELGEGDVPPERARIARRIRTPWERFDLMKEYRRSVPEEDQSAIWQQVDEAAAQFPKRRQTWKRTLQKAPPKSA